MNQNSIGHEWYQKFFNHGTNVGSGKVIDPRESTIYFEEIQNQLNIMFMLLHALSNPKQPELTVERANSMEFRSPELDYIPH